MRRVRRTATIAAAIVLAGALHAASAEPPEKLAPCLACHGAEGKSATENVPSLGAQMAPYTLIQLVMFREKMRVAEPMNEMTKELSDDDVRSLADAIAALPPPKPAEDRGDPARLERARALIEANRCSICHGPAFAGQQTAPRLADQREEYLLKTLRDYKSGARRAYEPIMVEVLQPVDDKALVELAYYLARAR
jgi:cytochrome c553